MIFIGLSRKVKPFSARSLAKLNDAPKDGVKSAGIPRIHYIKKEDYMRLITYIYVYIYNPTDGDTK